MSLQDARQNNENVHPKIEIYKNDIPASLNLIGDLAIDTEAMGLIIKRDRLCLLQLTDTTGTPYIVQFDGTDYSAPNLKKLLTDPDRLKIFHFARFDVAIIHHYLGVRTDPIYCTKVASRIARTYSTSHSLKALCGELLSVNLQKQQQCSNWSNKKLSYAQIKYAASDVMHLHELRDILDKMLIDNNRHELAYNCFKCIMTIAELDVAGWGPMQLFDHSAQHVYQS